MWFTGMLTIAIFCFMNALPHFLFGLGQDTLDVTLEYGQNATNKSAAEYEKGLCRVGGKCKQIL